MAYKERYQEFIEAQINIGGDPSLMDQCVAEYNLLESEGYKGGQLFEAWMRAAKHHCARCGTEFQHKVEGILPAPSTEALCSGCTEARTGEEADRLNDAGGSME